MSETIHDLMEKQEKLLNLPLNPIDKKKVRNYLKKLKEFGVQNE